MSTSEAETYRLDQVGIRMVQEPPLYSSYPINTPKAAISLLTEAFEGYDREVLAVVNLQNDLKPINMNIVSMGTLDQSIAHPREILKSVVLSNARYMMLFHNHPSGSLVPSEADISLTDRMQRLCALIDVPMLDHIIIGRHKQYYSFASNAILKVPEIPYAKSVEGLHFPNPVVSEKRTGWKTARDTTKEITEQLEQGVQELFDSDRYQAFLDCMAKFHRYSTNNTILIHMQRPGATMVAGYQAWKRDHGRYVRKGEKGIRILAPAPYRVKMEKDRLDPNTHEIVMDEKGNPVRDTVTVEKPSFRVVSVYDVTQTEGKALPSLGVNELEGSVKDYGRFLAAMEKLSPAPVAFREDGLGTAKGCFLPEENRIVLRSGMSEVQTLKTLIHEMAHAMLHAKGKEADRDLSTEELTAESIAYTVCRHYGIDTKDYSFGYIAGWSRERSTAQLRESLDTIRKTADAMITGINDRLRKLDPSAPCREQEPKGRGSTESKSEKRKAHAPKKSARELTR